MSKYTKIGTELGELVDSKNEAYGNSFAKSEEFFKLLYPNGIPVSSYGDILLIARIWDKLMRIATDRDALGENPYQDIAGYALLGINKEEQ